MHLVRGRWGKGHCSYTSEGFVLVSLSTVRGEARVRFWLRRPVEGGLSEDLEVQA